MTSACSADKKSATPIWLTCGGRTALLPDYRLQVWRYVVIEVAPELKHRYGQSWGFDDDNQAVLFCTARGKPAFVRKVLTDEVIYRNY